MTVLTVVVWKWLQPGHRATYAAEHVNAFARGFAHHYRRPHRMICITDEPAGIGPGIDVFPLWPELGDMQNPNGSGYPSCYRRLRLFSTALQAELGIVPGRMILSADLDLVFVGDLRPLFHRTDADFLGWRRIWAPRHRGPRQPPSYNGSLVMHRAGSMDWMWTEFDPETSPAAAHTAGYFGSDQAWISYRLQGSAPGWIKADGVYSFSSDIQARALPSNAKIISFNGRHKPWDADTQRHAPWIVDHWNV